MIDPDKIGLVLWEVITLLSVLLGGIGLMVLRRKVNGRPGFTERDQQLFFGLLQMPNIKFRNVS